MSTILEHAKDAASKITLAASDGTVTLREAWSIFGAVVHAAADAVDKLEDRQAGFSEIVEAAEAAFDTLVAPLDIRGLPVWAENQMKTLIRGQIRPAIEAMYDTLDASAAA